VDERFARKHVADRADAARGRMVVGDRPPHRSREVRLMRVHRDKQNDNQPVDPIPFPADLAAKLDQQDGEAASLRESAEGVFDAIDNMSRRIEDLARELNCLGYFDDDDDDPRAA
jgi:hypothetical protein